jgi:polyisoprenoid-binding protein YceI
MFKQQKNKTMKILNLIVMAALAAGMFACSGNGSETAQNDTTKVDSSAMEVTYAIKADSAIMWKGVMLKMYEHFGNLNLKEGKLKVKGNQVTGGSFVADLSTMVPKDKNYKGGKYTVENLVGHLKSAAFFAVDSFPTANFEITKVEGNVVTGNLTVRGKTNEEQVKDVVVVNNDSTITATGKLVFNRQKYGVSYKADGKDMLLSDDIELNLALVGVKQ